MRLNVLYTSVNTAEFFSAITQVVVAKRLTAIHRRIPQESQGSGTGVWHSACFTQVSSAADHSDQS
jgi:hypothetical protein